MRRGILLVMVGASALTVAVVAGHAQGPPAATASWVLWSKWITLQAPNLIPIPVLVHNPWVREKPAPSQGQCETLKRQAVESLGLGLEGAVESAVLAPGDGVILFHRGMPFLIASYQCWPDSINPNAGG